MENQFLEWAFKGLVAVVLTVGGWLGVSMAKAVAKNRDDLAAHKLHVSETYAKTESLKRIYELMDVISNDVKAILQRRDH